MPERYAIATKQPLLTEVEAMDDGRLTATVAACNAGRFDEAEAAARELLAINPLSTEACRVLAYVCLARGQPEKAVEYYRQALAGDPGSGLLHLELGRALQNCGRIPEAAEAYRRSCALQPADGFARELYAQTLMEEWLIAMGVRRVGREASKTYAAKLQSGFFRTYLSGSNVLDIGYRGNFGDALPIVEQAIGIDFGYPGYDGVHLPFPNQSQDAIYSSHCLEHVDDVTEVVREWFRVLKIGGYLVVTVPHQHLYERKREPPSLWNSDHRRFFTPARLLGVFEEALPPNTYRVRHMLDNDFLFDYRLPPETHPVGCYEIELVLQRMAAPTWNLL
jgi:tetratricopeptide (TPR) repeat protein